ncbi:hypothetical protein DM02DRAFT_659585 [Periconia macrospinosa]|uniref:Flavin reductase like domain-containing protein n=1 Tax=Periconia macrospinosa TaxID=97972 RepID=A0A2V1DD13_9PLEO|nr:hypothetical protein DM02DRAFT_659585 [Periconia macrospinosa]
MGTESELVLPVEAVDKEALIQRNPHGNWEEVQAKRVSYDSSEIWSVSKTPRPHWKVGEGASTSDEWKSKRRITIAPYEEDRATVQNYKLMISTSVYIPQFWLFYAPSLTMNSAVPRPVVVVSTVSKDGVANIAPFSYFQNVCTDPPLYSLSLVGDEPNDTLKNILETQECAVSFVSDWFIEAANYSSINTPPHISEWPLSGLTPGASCHVKPSIVSESAFSAECKLHSKQHLTNREGKQAATLVLLEVVMWHVREDLISGDPKRATADLKLLRPIWRGGGITYGTVVKGFELPRPVAWRKVKDEPGVQAVMTSIIA